jgi:hemerythrin
MANNLYDNFKSGQGNIGLIETFKSLVDYVQVHFTTEEKLLNENDYPYLLSHKQEHDKFIEKVKELYSRALSGSSRVSIEMLIFLRDWLLNHIIKTDKKYSKFLNNHNIY